MLWGQSLDQWNMIWRWRGCGGQFEVQLGESHFEYLGVYGIVIGALEVSFAGSRVGQ